MLFISIHFYSYVLISTAFISCNSVAHPVLYFCLLVLPHDSAIFLKQLPKPLVGGFAVIAGGYVRSRKGVVKLCSFE